MSLHREACEVSRIWLFTLHAKRHDTIVNIIKSNSFFLFDKGQSTCGRWVVVRPRILVMLYGSLEMVGWRWTLILKGMMTALRRKGVGRSGEFPPRQVKQLALLTSLLQPLAILFARKRYRCPPSQAQTPTPTKRHGPITFVHEEIAYYSSR